MERKIKIGSWNAIEKLRTWKKSSLTGKKVEKPEKNYTRSLEAVHEIENQ